MQHVVSSTNKKEGIWRCDPCRWYYYPEKGDPTQNIPPGTPFEDLPSTWRCPICREPKSMFTQIR